MKHFTYSLFLLIILAAFFVSCKDGEKGDDGDDGNTGTSYLTVTWTTEPTIFYMGADSSADIPLPNNGTDKQKDVSADDGSGSQDYTVFFYESDWDKSSILDTAYSISPGTYLVGSTDATWDTGSSDSNKKFITITANNTGAEGDSGKDGLSWYPEGIKGEDGDDGTDGLDRYYSFETSTGAFTGTEK